MSKVDNESAPVSYRIQDAVRVIGLGRATLYELAAAGKLKLSKVGGRTLVPRAELQRLVDEGMAVYQSEKRIGPARADLRRRD